MLTRKTAIPSLFAAASLLIAAGASGQAGQPAAHAGYHIVGRIALPGEGGWDYLLADAESHRLYVSHGTQVVVVDTERDSVIGVIRDTPGVHGIAIAPALGRGFTSNGRDSTVTVFDLRTLAPIQRITATGRNPDAIVYDPATRRVFTFNGGSASATVIDAATGRVIGTVPLPGKPEFARVDGRGRLWVNIEDRSEVVPMDTRAMTAGAPWPLAPCEEPSGMAADTVHHRLFIGCSNRTMAVMSSTDGRLITTLPIGAGVDGNAFDAATQLAFASNGEGTLTVIHEDSPDAYHVVASVATAPRARTMALDELTHRVYLSTAEFGAAPAASADNPRPRPPMIPGSFAVVVLAP